MLWLFLKKNPIKFSYNVYNCLVNIIFNKKIEKIQIFKQIFFTIAQYLCTHKQVHTQVLSQEMKSVTWV